MFPPSVFPFYLFFPFFVFSIFSILFSFLYTGISIISLCISKKKKNGKTKKKISVDNNYDKPKTEERKFKYIYTRMRKGWRKWERKDKERKTDGGNIH